MIASQVSLKTAVTLHGASSRSGNSASNEFKIAEFSDGLTVDDILTRSPSAHVRGDQAAGTGRDQVVMRLPLVLAGYLISRYPFNDCLDVTVISLAEARHLGDLNLKAQALARLDNVLREARPYPYPPWAAHTRRVQNQVPVSPDVIRAYGVVVLFGPPTNIGGRRAARRR